MSLSLDPCELLSPDDLAELGAFEGPEKLQMPDSRTCRWQLPPSMENDFNGIVVDLDIRDQQTVESMNPVGGGEVTTSEVNSRPTAVAPDPSGTNCTVGMKIDDVSRIDVGIVGPRGQSCDIATTVAYIVEPRLPALPS
ncbi:Protein of unknown function (DUF3558) [Saccharomonospora glauca K62]|uniref:DUF3558 domain-containing protein n=1 Tax=Saccharomonospora glauca K62 TaxID=928724 RepID=I1D6N6_9PSEU|nr:Protein of unknown function (DUF3558) [Saccharomonospora glauca K62]